MSAKVLITGGSGLIGTRLTTLLMEKGYDVAHLGRPRTRTGSVKSTRDNPVETFAWRPDQGQMDNKALEDRSAVIHLAGASIAGRRWTPAYKKEILDSRVNSTRLLFERIKLFKEVRTFICASAIGFYGQRTGAKIFTESDRPG